MTHKQNQTLETLTFGDLLVRDSGMSRNDYFKVVKLGSENLIASNFFGTKSASDRPQEKSTRNFRHEAELLIIDHFNGIENNFGFTKKTRGSKN
jgi:hypothetical protein